MASSLSRNHTEQQAEWGVLGGDCLPKLNEIEAAVAAAAAAKKQQGERKHERISTPPRRHHVFPLAAENRARHMNETCRVVLIARVSSIL